MPELPTSVKQPTSELRKNGTVVGRTDRVYAVSGPEVVFDEIAVLGDLSGVLDYNGHKVQVTAIDTAVGLEVGPYGARGPLWKGVRLTVLQ